MTEQKKTTTIPLPVQGKDMDSIMQSLESGVEELFTSNRYQEFLKTMAKFHNYSFNNTMLIAMQRPDATLVTSYKNWQSMGRQVMKGEKGITIIAPAPYKKMKENLRLNRWKLQFRILKQLPSLILLRHPGNQSRHWHRNY